MKLSLNDIQGWQQFEELVKHYFDGVEKQEENDVITSFIEPSGEGPDGGRDLLVTLTCRDSVVEYKRKWVVQCKFYGESVGPGDLSKIAVNDLLVQYEADGYLLVCKNGVTGTLTKMFEDLRKSKINKTFKFHYAFWTGEDFIRLIQNRMDLLQQYFPNYWNFLRQSK